MATARGRLPVCGLCADRGRPERTAKVLTMGTRTHFETVLRAAAVTVSWCPTDGSGVAAGNAYTSSKGGLRFVFGTLTARPAACGLIRQTDTKPPVPAHRRPGAW